ncbi:MAG: hypothetical protein BEU01_01345 [Marine Group III euryarchaeote CG-Epi4]|uniref:PKD/Chitinase domain-containing protein n=1 Tax=Marine Group III euryarchaeote CG-Epi4 TaxID=1888998 RepID=A0A1J5TI87_9ARCH|nr:MAG: hypothetical protein BEU01_01345 [Marine Group III euryarchaeote CG-Epi4]
MNLVRKFAALAFILIVIFSFNEGEAEKEPVWSWTSSSPVTNVAISSDSINITGVYGGKYSLWKNDTSQPYYNSSTFSEYPSYMETSSNGKYILLGAEGSRIWLYEESSKKWERGGFQQGLYGLDISDDGSNITVVDRRNVYFFNADSNTEVWNSNFPSQEMSTVSISPDGRYIAAGTFSGNVYVFLTSDEEDVWYHSDALDGKITSIDFSGDSSHLIIGTESGSVHVYPSSGGDPITMVQPNEVTCVSAGIGSKYYTYGTEEGMLTVFDGIVGDNIWQKDIGGVITDCTFNGKGTYVFAGSDNKKLVLTNVTNGDELWRVNAANSVTSVSLSYKGENLLVGTESGLSLFYEQLLDNQAPTASIDIIDPSTALPGVEILFTGSGTDIDGFVSNYHWFSSIDGNLSLSDNFTISNLTMGLHTIYFMVQDNEGRWSHPVTLEIGVGDFPEVSILSVSNCSDLANCMISLGDTMSISASAYSTTSDDITMEIFEWFSSLDGIISNDLNLTTSELGIGSHVLTFRAKNSVGFWSANVSINVLVNAVPTIILDTINPNPIIAGEEAQITVIGLDPDDEDILSYFWSTETVTLFNDNNKALFSSESTDKGNHIVSVYVQDSKGAKSNTLNITISILSQPSVELVCDPEIELNEEAFFTASAFKPQGSIIKYEWDFDSSSRVLPNSIDFTGLNFATHSYNLTSEDPDGYIVVVRVTDNDGLTATDYCQIPIVEKSSTGSGSSSGDDGGISSQLTTAGGLLGIAIVLAGISGLVFYFNRNSLDSYSPPDIPKPSKATPESSLFETKSSEEEARKTTKRKVIRKKAVSNDISEMMTVECPQCSSQIEVLKISGSQQLKCPDCGLEGEIDT